MIRAVETQCTRPACRFFKWRLAGTVVSLARQTSVDQLREYEVNQKLNKKLFLVAMLLAVKSAYAASGDASIEVYGVLDVGFAHASNALSASSQFSSGISSVNAKTANAGVSGLSNGEVAPSRIGFKGTEDVGNGWKTIFDLETGFNLPYGTYSNGVGSVAANTKSSITTNNADSSTAGQLFNRQAYVGLASEQYGTVTLGRNYSLGYDTMMAYDPLDGAQLFSPIGYSGSYAGGGLTEDFRIDDSVKYKYQYQNVNAGVLYKFGGQAGSTSAQSEAQATLGYDNGTFGIQATFSEVKDGLSAGNSNTLGTVSLTVANTQSAMLAASYKIDQFRLRGGYQRQTFKNPSNPALDATITTVLGYSVTGAVNTTAYTNEKKLDVYFVGVTYDFAKNVSASVAYYDVKQNDYSGGTCTGGSSLASCSGNNRFFSALAFYKLSKRTQLYAGFMKNKVDGGFASGFVNDTNNTVGLGIKHMF